MENFGNNIKQDAIRLLNKHSVKTGTFKLVSGRTSDFFIDCKASALTATGHLIIGRALLSKLEESFRDVQAVAGVELGGFPLASSVALLSTLDDEDLRHYNALYVRKQKKDHGTGQLVEGKDGVATGSKVVLLEDVVTTGGTSIKAVQTLREEGFDVIGVIALVDRQEGATQALQAAGITFYSVTTREELLKYR